MREWYAALAEREKRFVLFGAIGAVVLLLLGVWLPLNRNITQAQERVERKQADLAFIQSATAQLQASGPGATVNPDNLVVVIDSSARESGLGKSLTASEPTPDRGLRIRLQQLPFDSLVAWLARLSQSHGVRVETAEIEAAGEPGIVNATLTLRAG